MEMAKRARVTFQGVRRRFSAKRAFGSRGLLPVDLERFCGPVLDQVLSFGRCRLG